MWTPTNIMRMRNRMRIQIKRCKMVGG